MGEPRICSRCDMAGSTGVWHARLSASLSAGAMPVFDSKNLGLCTSVGVSTCAADWLTFGVGKWSLNPVPQCWVWLAGAARLSSTLSSCDLGRSNPLTCASLPVFPLQLVTLPEVIRKAFPIDESWRFLFPLYFLPFSLTPNIHSWH